MVDDIVWSPRKPGEDNRHRVIRNTSGKHVVGSAHTEEQCGWNEKSFRYTSITDSDEFYIPATFRQQSTSNRQASEGALQDDLQSLARDIYMQSCHDSFQAYRALLAIGVGREQARGVLVPSVYTTWVWTTSLQAVLHFIELRRGAGAQSEIALYAGAISELISPIVPEVLRTYMELSQK